MSARVLALDLGTHPGWAFSPLESGVLDLRPRRFESEGMRYVHWRRWLDTVLQGEGRPEVVVYEEVHRHLGVTAAHVYGGLMAILKERCEVLKINYTSLGVGEIKKHATGKGNANKEAMIAAAEARGWAPVDDNHADALFILDLYLSKQRSTTCSK